MPETNHRGMGITLPLLLLTLSAITISLFPTVGLAKDPPVATHKKSAREKSTSDLPNFGTVAPGIYRGGAPTEAGLNKLRSMGVHTVIDLRISPKQVKKEKEIAEGLGFKWINLPMGSEPPTSRQVATLRATLNHASTAEPVYVHCQHGADRTGCMVGIWRVTDQGWTFDSAWKEMRKYGFNPHWAKLTQSVKRASRP